MEGARLVILGALAAQDARRLDAGARLEGEQKARLADPGVALDHHALTLGLPGSRPALGKEPEFVRSPEERGMHRARRQPVPYPRLVQDPQDRDGLGAAGQPPPTQRPTREPAPDAAVPPRTYEKSAAHPGGQE